MNQKNKLIQKIKNPIVSLVGFSLAVIINLPHIVGVYHELTGKSGWFLYLGFAVVELGILILSINGKKNAAILFAWLVFLINGGYYWMQPAENDIYVRIVFGVLFSSIPAYMLYFFSELFADYIEKDNLWENYHLQKQELTTVKGQLTKTRKERDELRTSLDESWTELEILRTEKDENNKELDRLRQKLDKANQELDDYRKIAEFAALNPDTLRKRIERTPDRNGHAHTYRLLNIARELQRQK